MALLTSQAAVFLEDPHPPPVEVLARAFRSLPDLTDFDARNCSRNSYGILVERIPRSQAIALTGFLRKEGFNAMAVHQRTDWLPKRPTIVADIECTPTHFTFTGFGGQSGRVDWSHVRVVAVGKLPTLQVTQTEKEIDIVIGRQRTTIKAATKQEESATRLVIELYLGLKPARYLIPTQRHPNDKAPSQARISKRRHHMRFLTDLFTRAPQAILNRGAAMLSENPMKTYRYPTQEVFGKELAWLLWKAGWDYDNHCWSAEFETTETEWK